ncbi:hypothetical protein GEMRC1_004732 [Eukaryota sp. GEM-RC1]
MTDPLLTLFTHFYHENKVSRPHKVAELTLVLLREDPNTDLSASSELQGVLGDSLSLNLPWLHTIVSQLKSGADPTALIQHYSINPAIVELCKRKKKKTKSPPLNEPVLRQIPPWSTIPTPSIVYLNSGKLSIDGVRVEKSQTQSMAALSPEERNQLLSVSLQQQGSRLCRFYPNCTRHDCVFSHPTSEEADRMLSGLTPSTKPPGTPPV